MDIQLTVSKTNITSPNSLLEYKDIWDSILATNKSKNPFLSFEWINLWLNSFFPSKTMKLLFVKNGLQVKAFTPLFNEKVKLGKFNFDCFQLPANSHSNRCEFLIGEKTEANYQAILDFLFKKNPELDGLFLRLIPDNSPSLKILEKLSQNNHLLFATRPGVVSPSIILPESWDHYLLKLSKKTRYELRKKERRWDSLPGKKEEFFTDESSVEKLIDAVYTIEMNSWKAKEQKHLLVNEKVWNFYTQLIQRYLKLKLLHAIVLFVNEVPAAYELAINYKNILYSLKTSFNEIFKSLNCGRILRAKMLKRAFELGVAENDLLGDTEIWKQRFANKYQKHFYVYLLKNNFRNRIIWKTEFAVRPIAGKVKRRLVPS